MSRHRYTWSASTSYEGYWANCAIVLLKWLEENPDVPQTYRSLEEYTSIPRSTIWELLHWNCDLVPGRASPIEFWAARIGLSVQYIDKPGLIVAVIRQ